MIMIVVLNFLVGAIMTQLGIKNC